MGTIATDADLIALVTQEIKGLSSLLVPDDFTNAVAESKRETTYSIPNSVDFEIRWLRLRTIRHLLFMLWMESATKFKVKQLSLNQKFDHFGALITKMDEEYAASKDEILDVDVVKYFGVRIDAGFAYDEIGRDLTYSDRFPVVITPSEVD
jgi:hypothetical protein